MNDKDQDAQRRQSASRINQRIEAGEDAQGSTDRRVTALEKAIRKLQEVIRKLTGGT